MTDLKTFKNNIAFGINDAGQKDMQSKSMKIISMIH